MRGWGSLPLHSIFCQIETSTFQAISEMKEITPDRRYHQLMHLLEKSSIYTGFLLEKIKKEEEAKEANKEKIKAGQLEIKETKEEPEVETGGRGRRSKRKKATISEVIDKEVFVALAFLFKMCYNWSLANHNQSAIIFLQALIKRQRINDEGESAAPAEITKSKQELNKEVNKLLQPKLLTGAVLRDYQLYGVNWITTLYDNG